MKIKLLTWPERLYWLAPAFLCSLISHHPFPCPNPHPSLTGFRSPDHESSSLSHSLYFLSAYHAPPPTLLECLHCEARTLSCLLVCHHLVQCLPCNRWSINICWVNKQQGSNWKMGSFNPPEWLQDALQLNLIASVLLDPLVKWEGFPGGSIGKESACNVGDLGWKIPWRKEQLPTPVFYPGEFHGLFHGVASSQTQLSDFHSGEMRWP